MSDNIESKLSNIEDTIASKISEKYMKEINETIGHITGEDGAVAHSGVWNAKNKYTENKKTTVPVAHKDKQGNMVTNLEGIKKICLDEILERLRNRKMHPDFTELQSLKEFLCN